MQFVFNFVFQHFLTFYFNLIGDDGKIENENPGLLKDSESVYTLWCSGRTCCEGMLVELKFLKVSTCNHVNISKYLYYRRTLL